MSKTEPTIKLHVIEVYPGKWYWYADRILRSMEWRHTWGLARREAVLWAKRLGPSVKYEFEDKL